MKEHRQLAAIMFTDIVGYSALMSKDEKLAMEMVNKNRKIHKAAIEKFNGEYLQDIGDGTLSIFQSSWEAVRCAIEIQKACCEIASLRIRIGIHIGDIVFKDGDVFGDGVNIASRIESSGEPGGIYISGRVYEDIKNKSEINAEFKGEKQFKNIDYPIKVYSIQNKESHISKPGYHRTLQSKHTVKLKYPVIISTILVLAIIALFYFDLIPFWNKEKLNENLIAVAIFENQTGDESLDPIGRMASDWITQGIANTEILTIVPSFSFESGENIHQNMEAIRELAEEIRTQTIITGIFYKHGDQIQIHAHIVDAEREKVLLIIDPVNGPMVDPMVAIDELKQKVMGSLVSVFDPYFSVFGEKLTTPSYEAYREMMAGMDVFLQYKWKDAVRHFYKAAELDTNYIPALIMAMQTHSNIARNYDVVSEGEKADSLYYVIMQQANKLTPREKNTVAFMHAELHGDNETYYKNVKVIASSNYNTKYELGWATLITNRLEECINVMKPLNPKFKTLEGWYWNILCSAYHLTGKKKQELKTAILSRKDDPQSIRYLYNEARAYISSGKINRLDACIEESYNLTETNYWNPVSFMYEVAEELRLHGYHEESESMCRKAHDQCDEDDENDDYWMAMLFYLVDSWEKSQDLFENLHSNDPDNISYMALLGAIAAKQGDEEKKSHYIKLIKDVDPKFLNGSPSMFLARIAASSGNKDEAIEYIRKAFSRGYFRHRIHNVVEFEKLHDYPPFQELIKPR